MKLLALLLFMAVFIVGCKSQPGASSARTESMPPVVKNVKVGQFSYPCDKFQPQVKSSDEIRALFLSAREIIANEKAQNRALAASLSGAMGNHDVMRVEQIVVEYECNK